MAPRNSKKAVSNGGVTPTLSARGILEKKTGDSTKYQYNLYYVRFSKWLQEKYPNEYRTAAHDSQTGVGEVDFTDMPVSVFEEAFENFQYSGDGDGKAFVSFSKMDFYRKSLVYYHKKQGLDPVPKAVNDFFKGYIKGYSNVIAMEKHQGRMKASEGKDVITGKDEHNAAHY